MKKEKLWFLFHFVVNRCHNFFILHIIRHLSTFYYLRKSNEVIF